MGFFGFVLGLSAGAYLTKRMILKGQQQETLIEKEKQSMLQEYVNKKTENNNRQLLLNNKEDDNHSLLSLSREFITRIRNENFPILEAQEKSISDSLNSQSPMINKKAMENNS